MATRLLIAISVYEMKWKDRKNRKKNMNGKEMREMESGGEGERGVVSD